MNEEDIYEENNLYIIKKEINGKWVNFGIFSDLNKAIERRDELEEYGWPYQDNEPKNYEKIEKYIYKKDDRFLIIKKILDVNIIFGNFDEYDKAKHFKRKLIDNAWNVNSMNSRKKYGKYIQKSKDNFTIAKRFNNKTKFFGTYNNLDDAILKRNQLVDKNWGMDESTILENIGIHELNTLEDKNIAKVGRKYTVFKWEDHLCSILGFYSNHRTAILVRDKFIINNSIDYDILDESQKDTKYIIKVGDYYKISKMINGKNITFGHFNTLDKAIKVRNLFIKNHWDKKFINKYTNSNNKNINKHIHKNSRGFSVVNRIDGQLINFGTFNNLNDALNYRNNLENNNWLRNYEPEEENITEEKYDEYIYLKNDGHYYLKYEVDGEVRIFGIFDNPLDAIAARLDCLKNRWDTFSISEKDYMNKNFSDSELPFGKIINEDTTISEEEVIYPKDIKNYIDFPVTVGKSYKNRGWAIKRSYLNDLVPILKYEKICYFIFNDYKVKGKLNIHTHLFYNSNKRLSNYLLKLFEIDPNIQTRINLDLTYGKYELNSNLDGKIIKFTTKYSKSFKNGMFIIPRKYSVKILPQLNYETDCYFSINDIVCTGRFNLEFRMIFNNPDFKEYLEINKKENDDLDICILL